MCVIFYIILKFVWLEETFKGCCLCYTNFHTFSMRSRSDNVQQIEEKKTTKTKKRRRSKRESQNRQRLPKSCENFCFDFAISRCAHRFHFKRRIATLTSATIAPAIISFNFIKITVKEKVSKVSLRSLEFFFLFEFFLLFSVAGFLSNRLSFFGLHVKQLTEAAYEKRLFYMYIYVSLCVFECVH